MAEGVTRFRTLAGTPRVLERLLLLALTLTGAAWAAHLHHALPWALFPQQYLGAFLGLGLAPVFVAVRASVRAPTDRVPALDWALAAAALVVGGYVAVLYPRIAYQLGVLTWDKVLLGALAVGLALEAVRRVTGQALMWIGVACVLYVKFAYLFPGLLNAKGASWSRIAAYLYLDTNGILGVPLSVTAGIVVAYVLFGQALYAVGGDRFLTDLALVAMGRYRGGAAKMAVVSSSLYGTVSGSAVANVVVDGAVTIPMMKRAGYPPHVAAAIEAVSSNGGQIMPPVMGAAAFLIAEYLSLPYGQVALAAAVPAALYYLALFVQVDLEAARHGLAGLPASEVPRLGRVIRRGGVFVLPLSFLLYALMSAGWEAGQAGMAAVALTLGVGMLHASTRPSWAGLGRMLEGAGRTMLDLVAVVTLAGIVIGALQLSGFTSKLPLLLVSLAGESAMLLLLLTAVVSIVLGMSLPTTVVYVTLAVLVGPALAQLGIVPLAAHLFLFYFGMLSLITPPDCLATYAAAAIARADFWRTGWTGMRLGIVAYVIPFAFVFQPALILHAGAGEVLLAVAAAAAGTVWLAVGCAGHLFRPLRWPRRAAFIAAGLLLLARPGASGWLVVNAAGLVLGLVLLGLERGRTRAYCTALVSTK